ncbi:MAG: glycogen debranching enzyme family protein [Bacteroidales bacterium]|nr:glycogen debranching enzyme family protein [Bacteroidales bacterium]
MSYIKFDKDCLINLESALNKEIVRSNRAGGFACNTIIGCNTRKYHGLLVVPQPMIDNEHHVLLSSLDETIIQQNNEFNLGIHKYPGNIYYPKGHKYCTEFSIEVIPVLKYNIGGVELTKERIFSQSEDRLIMRYNLVNAKSPTVLRIRPFLAYRNIHKLSKANVFVETKYTEISNGIRVRMYTGYSYLYFQFSKKPDYVHNPDWYYNIEYEQERERGYEYNEDLFVPGYFDIPIAKGETLFLSVGTDEINPDKLASVFEKEYEERTPRNSFENCLKNSAEQFIVRRDKKTKIIAGFPWFGSWGRDTFIALPGLTLSYGNVKDCKAVIDTMISEMNGPLFPNFQGTERNSYNSVDAPLWFFWALQQYTIYIDDKSAVWKEYGAQMRLILNAFRDGTYFGIKMLENGLLYAGEPGFSLTWMDAIVHSKSVTPRIGLPVEINALWYNALKFASDCAISSNDNYFSEQWKKVIDNLPAQFNSTFWDQSKGYLADFVNGDYKDYSVRPNQVIACSLPYTMLKDEQIKTILEIVKKELLTPRGLRSLSPKHPDYIGICCGDQTSRDLAYHQGTAWPWLIGAFAEAYLRIYGSSGVDFIRKIYEGFGETMTEHGIGSISEIYDGTPPYTPRGAISQAWSIAEVVRMGKLLKQYSKKTLKIAKTKRK